MMNRCYWDYVRVYVPEGSRLRQRPDLPWPAASLAARDGSQNPEEPFQTVLEQDDLTAWADFFVLRPGESRTLTYAYELPAWVQIPAEVGVTRYHLRVAKQPGTGAVPLQVEVVLPPGATVVESTMEGRLSISTDLSVDRQFAVTYRTGMGNQ
jgi:hypothetical protein